MRSITHIANEIINIPLANLATIHNIKLAKNDSKEQTLEQIDQLMEDLKDQLHKLGDELYEIAGK